MKSLPLFLAVLTLSLAGCNTPANRRNLYGPGDASGPYSKALDNHTWQKGVKTPPVKASTKPMIDPTVAPAM